MSDWLMFKMIRNHQPQASCPEALRSSRPRRLAALLVLAGLLTFGPRQARADGDAAEGRRLAGVWCSDCHQVDPRPQGTASDAVPSFRAIAATPSTTVLSIRAFLRTPHDVMPDYRLTEAQIDDLSAYILSLPRRAPE